MVKSKLNDSWIVSYKEMKRYKDIIKGLRQQSKETEKKIKEYYNGLLNRFTDIKVIHDNTVSIEHKDICLSQILLIKSLMINLEDKFPEYFKESDKNE